MKKIIILAIYSVLIFTSYAQDGDPRCVSAGQGCEPVVTIYPDGLEIKYQKCGDHIEIISIKHVFPNVPTTLFFTNTVIPVMLELVLGNQTAYVKFEASCVKWQKTNCRVVQVPIPGKLGWFQTEGEICDYDMADCSSKGCCIWDLSGDGLNVSGNGMGNSTFDGCKDIQPDPNRWDEGCFPLCSGALKSLTFKPITGEEPFQLTPNIGKDYIRLNHVNNLHSIIIVDITGKVIYSQAPEKLIDITKFNNGMYFMRLQRLDGKYEVKRFEKKSDLY
jgi:hypothetical protein